MQNGGNQLSSPGRKLLSVAIVLSMLISGMAFLAVSQEASAAGEGWLDGWQYRKSHAINPAAGAGTNYPVLIHAMSGTGTDTTETYQGIPAGKVYLNGRAQADFDDVRFTAADGVTLLDYCVESKTDGVDAYIWVEIAADISSVGTTIYVYYGNAAATSASNGNATFLWYDDYSSNASARFVTNQSGVSSLTFSGGYLRASITDKGYLKVITASTFGPGAAVRQHLKLPTGEGAAAYSCIGFASSDDTDHVYFNQYNVDGQYNVRKSTAGTSEVPFNPSLITGSFITTEVRYATSKCQFQQNADTVGTLSDATNIPTVALPLVYNVCTISGRSQAVDVDWTFVRKYIAIEPTQGTWGAESSATLSFTSSPSLKAGYNQTYSYIPTLSDAGTISAETLPHWMTFSGGVLSGVPDALGSYQIVLKGISGDKVIYQNFLVDVGRWLKAGVVLPKTTTVAYAEPIVIADSDPQVLTGEAEVLKMWVRGYNDQLADVYLYYAESTDGITWTYAKGGVPVLTAPKELWCPFVGKIDGTYYLMAHADWPQIDLYTSANGVDWTLDTPQVIPLGATGAWDDSIFGNTCFWKEGDTWHLFYEASGDEGQHWHMGHATSTDGRNWVKDAAHNPIIPMGTLDGSQGTMDIHKVGSKYVMVFPNSPTGNLPSDIYIMVSDDLYSWTNLYGNEPALAREYDWEGADNPKGQVVDPSIVEWNGQTLMFYNACTDQTWPMQHGIAMASYGGSMQQMISVPESATPGTSQWAPSFTSIPPARAAVNSSYQYTPATNTTSTIALVSGPAWLTLQDGALSGIPIGAGTYSVTISATSTAGGGTTTQTWEITVTESTSLVSDGDMSMLISLLVLVMVISFLVAMIGKLG